MTTPLTRLAVILQIVCATCINQAQAGDCPPISSPSYLSVESPASKDSARQLGEGPYSYRFVVRNPQRIDQPFRNGRYQIELKGEATFPDGTHFYRGKTDRFGRTIVVHFGQPIPEDSWYVQPLVGQGEFGESFQLTDDTGCQNQLGNLPYLLNEQLGGIFCGRTLPDGTTIRYMSQSAREMALYQTSTKECRSLQRAVNPAMALSSPASRTAALQRLLKAPRFSAHQELLQGKIDALLIRYGSLAQIKTMVSHQLATASPDEQSAILNSIAYQLITQSPPRQLHYASSLLDQSLAIEENIYNLDSKAWVLHLLGKDDEALTWINRSLALYGTSCNEGESSSYPEALAHRGMILWTLKRWSAALSDWTLAHMSTQAGGWANFTPSWNSIEPLITAREAELKAEGFANPICSKNAPPPANAEVNVPM